MINLRRAKSRKFIDFEESSSCPITSHSYKYISQSTYYKSCKRERIDHNDQHGVWNSLQTTDL